MRRIVSVVVVSGLIVGCGAFSGDDPAPEAPAPGTPADNAKPPPPDGKPIPGVYVSTSLGNDDGTGSPERPLKTLKKAFALANDQHLRVIACAEVYEENLTLVDGVSAYGYYECAVTPWKRGERRAVVKAKESPAVIAKGVKLPTRIEGFEIVAPDVDKAPATETSGSSIALEVRDSRELAISESLLRGGKASPGSDGEAGPENSVTVPGEGAPARDQGATTCNPMVVVCTARVVQGGPGAAAAACAIGAPGGAGGQGGDGRFHIGSDPNTVAAEHRGRPLIASASTAIGGGVRLAGETGTAGPDGSDGVNGAWSISATGFLRGNGTAGTAGQPGQGGGGGGGTASWFQQSGLAGSPVPLPPYWETATGGGGGSGGCAGQPGTPATGGGASIGALIVASSVSIELTRVESSAGGKAGLGNLGRKGTFGNKRGVGAFVNGFAITGAGGPGGPGGNGGASGHGAAGPSIALAFSGTRPVLTKTELVPGPGGAGQPELRGITPLGANKLLPAAAPGPSEAEHEIKP
jgi:hypothetical protein